MDKSEWIAYVGNFPFPTGKASSRRVYGVASALVEAGYNVLVLSNDTKPLEPCILKKDKEGSALSYLGTSDRLLSDASSIRKAYEYLFALGKRKVRWLDEQPTKPKYVIYYGSDSAFWLRLHLWCSKHKVPLIVDIGEWRDSSHMVAGGRISPFNISDKICMKFLIQRSNGVIAGSSFLENYYLKRNSNVIRIPIILDTVGIQANFQYTKFGDDHITLAYAGNSGKGKKDLLNNIIEAVLQLRSDGKNVLLHLAGPTPDDVLGFRALRSRKISSLPPWIKAYGWQPLDKALDIVRNADFMPLLRPMNRTSQAGSPTKFFESLTMGTPVICNLTSDLGHYLQDGIEGLVCRDSSVDTFKEAIERAFALKPEEYGEMRRAARARAEESFDFRAYAKPLSCFLDDID